MKHRPVTLYQIPELDGKAGRALVACGLWMRLGFVGASVVAVGLIQLFGSETSPLSAFALAASGAALAVLSWRRAHAALSKSDGPATPTVAEPAPASVRSVAGA
jgi:hypothetical protein